MKSFIAIKIFAINRDIFFRKNFELAKIFLEFLNVNLISRLILQKLTKLIHCFSNFDPEEFLLRAVKILLFKDDQITQVE